MLRTFKITLPADTAIHNLFSLIVGPPYTVANGGTAETGITGAIPSEGILPDRGCSLQITSDSANTGNIAIQDRNATPSPGRLLAANAVYSVQSSRNSICYKDYFLQGSAASQIAEVCFEII